MGYDYQNLPIGFDDDGNPYVIDGGEFGVDHGHSTEGRIEDMIPDGAGEPGMKDRQ